MSKEIKSRSSPEHDAAKSLRKPFGIDRGLFRMGDASPLSDESYRTAMEEGRRLIAAERFSPRLLKDHTNTVRDWVKDQTDLTKGQKEHLEAFFNNVHDAYKAYNRDYNKSKIFNVNLSDAKNDFKIAAQGYLDKVQSYMSDRTEAENFERASVSASVRSDTSLRRPLLGNFSDSTVEYQPLEQVRDQEVQNPYTVENQTPEQVRDQEVQRILAPGAEYKNRSDLVDHARVSELGALWKSSHEIHEKVQNGIDEELIDQNSDLHILKYNIEREIDKVYTVIKDLEVPEGTRLEQKRIFGKKQKADEGIFHEKVSGSVSKKLYSSVDSYNRTLFDVNHRLAHREGHRLQQEYGSAELEKDPQLQEFPEREYSGENLKKWHDQINEYGKALEQQVKNPEAPYIAHNETSDDVKMKLRDEDLFSHLDSMGTHVSSELDGAFQSQSPAERYAQHLFDKLRIDEIEPWHDRLVKEKSYRDHPQWAKREKRTTTFEDLSDKHLDLLLREAKAQIQASGGALYLKSEMIPRAVKYAQKALDVLEMGKLKPRNLSPVIDNIPRSVRGRTFLRLKPKDQERMWQELDRYDKANNTNTATTLVGSLSKYEVGMLLGTKSSPQQNRSLEALQNQVTSQKQEPTNTFRDIVSHSHYNYLLEDN